MSDEKKDFESDYKKTRTKRREKILGIDLRTSAGIIADCIRVSKIAKDRRIGGALSSACSFFSENSPVQLPDFIAKKNLMKFILNKKER